MKWYWFSSDGGKVGELNDRDLPAIRNFTEWQAHLRVIVDTDGIHIRTQTTAGGYEYTQFFIREDLLDAHRPEAEEPHPSPDQA